MSQKRNPSTSRSSTDEIQKDFYMYKLRKANKEFLRCQRKKQEFAEKHLCERSPYIIHDYQPHKPFVGCFKQVCKFCLQESPDENFQQSVYAHKGKRFGSEKKKRPTKKKQQNPVPFPKNV